MAASVKGSRGRLVYTERVAWAPFVAWTKTKGGQGALASAASGIRFSIFAKERRARRRLWRQLVAAAADARLAAAMEREVAAYPGRVADLAYADGLPRLGISLHRLVVVPRVLVNAAAYHGVEAALRARAPFLSVREGEALRSFMCQQFVGEMDRALAGLRPSLKRALPAGPDWIIVGANAGFVWRLPFLDWPAWNGHYYVLELTRQPITRRVRKEAAAAITQLEASLPALTRLQRTEMLRRASAPEFQDDGAAVKAAHGLR